MFPTLGLVNDELGKSGVAINTKIQQGGPGEPYAEPTLYNVYRPDYDYQLNILLVKSQERKNYWEDYPCLIPSLLFPVLLHRQLLLSMVSVPLTRLLFQEGGRKTSLVLGRGMK